MNSGFYIPFPDPPDEQSSLDEKTKWVDGCSEVLAFFVDTVAEVKSEFSPDLIKNNLEVIREMFLSFVRMDRFGASDIDTESTTEEMVKYIKQPRRAIVVFLYHIFKFGYYLLDKDVNFRKWIRENKPIHPATRQIATVLIFAEKIKSRHSPIEERGTA
jgi:hypothetical protein